VLNFPIDSLTCRRGDRSIQVASSRRRRPELQPAVWARSRGFRASRPAAAEAITLSEPVPDRKISSRPRMPVCEWVLSQTKPAITSRNRFADRLETQIDLGSTARCVTFRPAQKTVTSCRQSICHDNVFALSINDCGRRSRVARGLRLHRQRPTCRHRIRHVSEKCVRRDSRRPRPPSHVVQHTGGSDIEKEQAVLPAGALHGHDHGPRLSDGTSADRLDA
jgi:hypothetical protein